MGKKEIKRDLDIIMKDGDKNIWATYERAKNYIYRVVKSSGEYDELIKYVCKGLRI